MVLTSAGTVPSTKSNSRFTSGFALVTYIALVRVVLYLLPATATFATNCTISHAGNIRLGVTWTSRR
jgi:hypothetical protein